MVEKYGINRVSEFRVHVLLSVGEIGLRLQHKAFCLLGQFCKE